MSESSGIRPRTVVLMTSEDVQKEAKLRTAEVIGEVAAEVLERGTETDQIVVEARKIHDIVYQAMGVGNTHLIATSQGHVVFDTGVVVQAAKHRRLLDEIIPEAPITHVIVSHSHQDHAGGVQFWVEDGTEIVAHREYLEEQRYLKELEDFLWQRNRLLFPWIPESPPKGNFMEYGNVVPTKFVDDGEVYAFEQGGVRFEVLPTPGAEGADNICLWLPDQKILFTGDTLGPLFPQFPNVFTMRGEKVRKPIESVHTLDRLIALEPEVVVPSHFKAVKGKETIVASLTRIRDAVQYVHDETIAGMNAGKTVYQLMDEIRLPEHLTLTQGHGRVSWAVKSIWEYYATWFQFESTTELYHVPRTTIHAELGGIAGTRALVEAARAHTAAGRPLEALHFLDIALDADPLHREGLQARKDALQILLDEAVNGLRNTYEIKWIEKRIEQADAALAGQATS
jgi:alkyl sulfatase BDS1-like metallo-beta-lactamase superfamily hydrolase